MSRRALCSLTVLGLALLAASAARGGDAGVARSPGTAPKLAAVCKLITSAEATRIVRPYGFTPARPTSFRIKPANGACWIDLEVGCGPGKASGCWVAIASFFVQPVPNGYTSKFVQAMALKGAKVTKLTGLGPEAFVASSGGPLFHTMLLVGSRDLTLTLRGGRPLDASDARRKRAEIISLARVAYPRLKRL